MAIIGTFRTTKDGLSGHISTLKIGVEAQFQPVEKAGEKSPDYRVTSHGGEIGAAWSKTSKDGKPYLSVMLDDPSFDAPINCALFEAEDGKHHLIWNR